MKSVLDFNVSNNIIIGDCLQELKQLQSSQFQCCITSPPYWGLRDYGIAGQIGAEDSVEVYIQNLVEIFREVKRVLKDDGTLWVNIFALVGVPASSATACVLLFSPLLVFLYNAFLPLFCPCWCS